MAKETMFTSKRGKAAEWEFHPNAKTRKKYPDAEIDFLGMDAQEGEFLSLKETGRSELKDKLVIDIAEGRIELNKFSSTWQEVEAIPTDSENIWNIDQMISTWSSND